MKIASKHHFNKKTMSTNINNGTPLKSNLVGKKQRKAFDRRKAAIKRDQKKFAIQLLKITLVH